MTTVKSILNRLTQGVSGTEKELFTDEELKEFAEFYCDKWDENTSEDVIAESFVDHWWHRPKLSCFRCIYCGKLMREDYCLNISTGDYYCMECFRF